MSEKEAIINKKIVCKERTTIFSEKLVLGSLIFILSFVRWAMRKLCRIRLFPAGYSNYKRIKQIITGKSDKRACEGPIPRKQMINNICKYMKKAAEINTLTPFCVNTRKYFFIFSQV